MMSTDKYTSVSLSAVDKSTWKTVRLGEVCTIKRGVRVVRAQLSQGKYVVFQNSMTPLGLYDKANTEGQTTFIIGAGSAGEIGYSEAPFWAADDCFYLQPQNNVINKYIFYCLLSQKSFISTLVRRGSVPRLSRDVLGAIHINLPQYHTQQDIVNSLSFIDSQIISLEKLIDKQEAIKKSTVKLLMTPKPGWHQYLLGDCVTIFTGATPSTEHSEYWNGEIPWMSSGEVNSRFIYRTNAFITQEGYNATSTHMIPVNSVLIALAGQGKTRGKVAINKIELCTNQSLASLLPNLKLDYQFLFYNLEERYEELRELSSGDGGRGGLNVPILKNLPIVLPPVNEQHRIAQKISNLDISIQNFAIQLKKAQDVKMGMMSYFFD